MKRLTIYVLLTLLLASLIICYKSCNLTSEVLITVSPVADHDSGCYRVQPQEYRCNCLQGALELHTMTIFEICTLFDVQLAPGTHNITRPIITNSSLYFHSSNTAQPAIVSCSFDGEDIFNETRNLHTLYFNQSNLVKFSDLRFEGCPLPIRIAESNIVMIEETSFRYFTEAVLDIHNSIQVTINNCSFVDNRGSGIINEPYRGNTGGLSITYNHMNRQARNALVIVNTSDFINNSVTSAMNVFGTNHVLESGVFTGRGGGIGVFVRENNFNVSITISGCQFHQNFATSYGGGMYVLFNGKGSHLAYIVKNVYKSNVAVRGGAGLTLVGIKGDISSPHFFNVVECELVQNKAKVGGGLLYVVNVGSGKSNILCIESTLFDSNELLDRSTSFGAAIATDTEDKLRRESSITNVIKNCEFYDNSGENSIISIGLQPFEFSGTNRFINNKGSVLRVVGALVTLGGTVEFINNTVLDGAAILLHLYSQMSLADNLQLLFDGNLGRFGASISVSAVPSLVPFQRIFHNPLCFFVLKSDPLLSPSIWQNFGINITFTRNSALFGSAIYATSIAPCSWVSNSIEQSFSLFYFPDWPIFDIREDNINRAFSDTRDQIHSIVTDAVNLGNFSLRETMIWPGKNVLLSVQAIDELGNPTGSIARLSFIFSSENPSKMHETVELDPNALVISKEIFTANFSYGINAINGNGNINGDIFIESFGALFLLGESSSEMLDLTSTNCIGGYVLARVGETGSIEECRCDETEKNVLFCEKNQDSIIIKSGQWAMETNGLLFFHLCPQGYCRCFLNTSSGSDSCLNVFTNSDPDRQCVCGRKGILCGECVPGTGITVLLNQCTVCENGLFALIPLLIIINIVAMTLIILADKPLPHWSYPVIFYVQNASLASFHFPVSFISIGRYLLYIASALSFYFPYDFCMDSGMTSLNSFSLRFIPVISALIAITTAYLLRFLIPKFFHSCSLHSLNGHGIWAVLLLVYSFTLYSAAAILNCPTIKSNSGKSQRWFVDGSVECFSGGHIPLTLFAMIWIILLGLLIPLTVSLTVKRLKKCNNSLERIGTSLMKPFSTHHGYWCGVELCRRLFVVLFVTAFPNNSVLVLMLIMTLILLYGYCNPYKGKIANILEIVLLLIFLILLMLRISPPLQDMLEMVPSSKETSIPSCSSDILTVVTNFSSVLLALYYFPVIIGIILLCTWSLIALKKKLGHKYAIFSKIKLGNKNFEMKKASFKRKEYFAHRLEHPTYYDERHFSSDTDYIVYSECDVEY